MATLAEYETALEVCVAEPTPTNAARAANLHAVLAKSGSAEGGNTFTRPDLPEWVGNLARRFSEEAAASAEASVGPRVIYGRPSYGDGR